MKTTVKLHLLLACLLVASPTVRAADDGVDEERPKPVGLLQQLGTLLDSMAIRGMDRRYVELPAKPWQVIVQGSINQTDLKMQATIDGSQLFAPDWGDIRWRPRIKTSVSSYLGVWVGYRGYGLGYTKNVGGDKGSFLKLGAIGGKYGVNLRIHTFRADEPLVRLDGYMPDYQSQEAQYPVDPPVRVRTLTFDGYYFFNGNRFSHCAAYDQSVIQRRSAGTFMVGAMYYHSSVKYDDLENLGFIMFMDDIGKIRQTQVNLGGGYAYNLVPCRGLLVNAMLMPMVTVYNRVDVWRYHSLLRDVLLTLRANPTPDDSQLSAIANQPLELRPVGRETHHGHMQLNFDARLSLTYNVGDWFLNANGQLTRFGHHHDGCKVSLVDWYVNASVGIRL